MKNFSSSVNAHALNLEDLLSTSIIAISKANSEMAKEQMSFILNNCFEIDSVKKSLKPKTVTITVTKNISNTTEFDNAQYIKTELDIPIITLLPFSSLCVKDFKTVFDLEIKTHVKKNSKSNQNTDSKSKYALKSCISYDTSKTKSNHRDSSKKASIHVEINGGEIPLPNGLKTILNAYTKNIIPTKTSKQDE